ncbi:MAG: hypothetical protein MI892_05250, partial [Desulfobacterales bacterium]|nr:hypothetical protein [Desulfobacterales bacterium]
RTCLDDEFDIKALKKVLDELDRGEIIWSAAHTAKPSPFAAALAWNQINQYMYQQDQPAASRSNLGDSLIQEVLFSPELRPVIPKNIIEAFELKRQRLAKGYGPDTPADMVDWVRDRVALPEPEWDSLTRGLAEDIGHDQVSGLLEMACDRLVKVQPKGSPSFFIASLEMVGDIKAGWYEQKEQPAITDISGRKIETVSLAPQDETASGLDLFSQWLSFYGPRPPEWCGNILGLEQGCLESYVSDLTDTRTLVSGLLGEEADTQEICDARNLDILIRMHRAKQRPGFDPLDIGMLPLLLAHSQGLIPGAGQPQESLDQVFEHIERLSCMSLPAGLWEREVLPARVRDYHPAFMDSLLQEGDCLWLGRPKETVLLCLDQDVDLLPAREKEQPNTEINPEADPGIHQTGQSSDQKASLAEIAWERICELPDSLYDYNAMKQVTGLDDSDLTTLVWEKVWQGKLSSRGLSALRTGIMQGFKIPDKLVLNQAGQRTTGRVGRRVRGRAYRSKPRASANVGRALTGQWFRPEFAHQDMDLVDREEILKDRIRLLLDRYGVLFRELLAREMPGFRWADSFKTLYLMELAGEVLAGSFFKDIQGPQFISHEAFRRLKAGLDTKGAYWINAADPASACGLGSLSKGLPKRLASNHLVYKGAKLVLVSMRKGKELDIFVDPDDENLPTYFAPLSHMLTRSFD